MKAPANATTYTDATAAATTTYTYRVQALITVGVNSAYSNEAEGTTTAVPPPADPTGLKAAAVSDVQVNLGWNDIATTEDGYRIERCTGTTVTCNDGDFSQIAEYVIAVVLHQWINIKPNGHQTGQRHRLVRQRVDHRRSGRIPDKQSDGSNQQFHVHASKTYNNTMFLTGKSPGSRSIHIGTRCKADEKGAHFRDLATKQLACIGVPKFVDNLETN